MANHPSAVKRIRRNARRAAINKSRIGRMKTSVARIEQAIAGGDHAAAMAALRAAQPEIHRGVAKGMLHANTASRRVSRLNARIKALAKPA
ncbi:MAG: 30S ribosomal protein S20 [Thermodesulfobacteriota bacterium]